MLLASVCISHNSGLIKTGGSNFIAIFLAISSCSSSFAYHSTHNYTACSNVRPLLKFFCTHHFIHVYSNTIFCTISAKSCSLTQSLLCCCPFSFTLDSSHYQHTSIIPAVILSHAENTPLSHCLLFWFLASSPIFT